MEQTTQMTKLVEKALRSYFNCIPYVQETRVKNEYVSGSNTEDIF